MAGVFGRSVAALDALGTEYAQRGKTAETAETAEIAETAGLTEPGARMHRTPSGELAGG
ncbi:hypothetical protein ABZ753_17105 [Streptomyces griseoincarnatus]